MDQPAVRQLVGIFSIGLVAVAGVAIATGFKPLQFRAGELRQVSPRVSVEWPPLAGESSSRPERENDPPRTWVPVEVRESVERLALAHISENPLDDRSLVRAREALLRQGWFTDDLLLRRTPSGVVEVTGTWRFPVAVVRQMDQGLAQDHLVASSGELLPLAYAAGKSGLKIISGSPHDPPAPGQPWLGGEVQEALRLLSLLRAHECFRQVAGVDVGQFADKRRLELVTDRNNRVWWGGPTEGLNPGEVATEEKLQRLTRLIRDHGRIDADRPIVDIRTQGGSFVVLGPESLSSQPVSSDPRSPSGSSSPPSRNPGSSARPSKGSPANRPR